MRTIKWLIKVVFILSLIVFVIAFLEKDKLPPKEEILKELYGAPLQTKTKADQFQKTVGGITYTIDPQFDYELYGLVVSYHHSDVWWDMEHKEWNDFLNNEDIGVAWGENLRSGVYADMRFSSGSWTLYWDFKFGTPPSKQKAIISKFNPYQVSNNHVLPDNDSIAALMLSVKKGDQIWMKGYLVNYITDEWEGQWRRSSTTRDDSGSGACEAVYVKDFKILKRADNIWRSAYPISKTSMLTCLILYVIVFSLEAFRLGR